MVVHKTHKPHLATAPDARAVRTRKLLRETLVELLETRQFDQVTIGDLAEAAGVGYSTVCRHYPTLDSLLEEVAAEQIARVIQLTFPKFDVRDARSASMALFTQIHQHRAVWSTLMLGGAADALRQEFLRVTQQLANAWNQPMVPWLPKDLGVVMTVTGTIELIGWWLRQPEPMPVEQIVDIFHRMLVAPMLNTTART